ncbi:hypothetical protein V8C86DRAFT_2475753 [Haematococcus lacustris]
MLRAWWPGGGSVGRCAALHCLLTWALLCWVCCCCVTAASRPPPAARSPDDPLCALPTDPGAVRASAVPASAASCPPALRLSWVLLGCCWAVSWMPHS